jgi:hypothetical protein
MTQNTVWLNTHFNTIQLIRDADVAGEFRIVASYPSYKYADVLLADVFEVEPKLSDIEYVQYALDFVVRHQVKVFLPGRRINEIARHLDAFEALGVKVIVAADAETLETLDDKGAFYDALADGPLELPDYRVARTPIQFMAAVDYLQSRNAVVCFKPTVGIFGYGFKIIQSEDNANLLREIDPNLVTDLPGALQALGKASQFKPQIVLEYLPGVERSVDCLAFQGRLVRCVVRRKLDDGSRVLERNPFIEKQTKQLVEFFKLDGLFNVQFKDKDGRPFLLEINARMSGGIATSCLSGVVFPYWAFKIALDPACLDAIPENKAGGLRVAELTRAVILG